MKNEFSIKILNPVYKKIRSSQKIKKSLFDLKNRSKSPLKENQSKKSKNHVNFNINDSDYDNYDNKTDKSITSPSRKINKIEINLANRSIDNLANRNRTLHENLPTKNEPTLRQKIRILEDFSQKIDTIKKDKNSIYSRKLLFNVK